MTDTSASNRGRRSRKRGHLCERAVCSWLRANGYPEAHTTRSELGHDGSRTPGDIAGGPVGWVIETKDVASSAWPTWCRQADLEADGGPWCVVRRLRGQPDVGFWPCRFAKPTSGTLADPARWTFGQFVAWFAAGSGGYTSADER